MLKLMYEYFFNRIITLACCSIPLQWLNIGFRLDAKHPKKNLCNHIKYLHKPQYHQPKVIQIHLNIHGHLKILVVMVLLLSMSFGGFFLPIFLRKDFFLEAYMVFRISISLISMFYHSCFMFLRVLA